MEPNLIGLLSKAEFLKGQYQLGPLLFIIYLNDIDFGIENIIYKFADATKLAAKVQVVNGAIKLQQNIVKLIGSGDKWQMEFITNKCNVIHICKKNINFEYKMGNKWFES